jgi:predicted RNA-binding Zn-ribbon protein involved in translation (DUF1610 family)
MKKQFFIESIVAIQLQIQHDILVSEKLGEAFPNSFKANLLPDNHWLQNALVKNLQIAMNDEFDTKYKQSWIEYFCWELNFGAENYRLKAFDKNKKEIPLSTPGELWEFLKKNNKNEKPCPNCGEKENIHPNSDEAREIDNYLCNECGTFFE